MDAPLVSLILVTWNSAPFLRRCLAGIAHQTHPGLELIAVDNGSSDGSADAVAARFPDARIIRNAENRGFAAAVNQGIAAARGEFVLLCNPDAHLEPEYVARLVAAFGDGIGMATGKLLHGEGYEIAPTRVVDSKGIRMTRTGRHFDIQQGEPDDDSVFGDRFSVFAGADRKPNTENRSPAYEVFGVSGAAAMYRAAFLRDVAIDGQPFDEDFFTYREDADLAWRGQLFGWRALYVPSAVGYHVRTVTPQKRRELSAAVNMHSVKNRFLLRLKNEGPWLALRNAPFEIPRDLVAIAAVLTIERTSLPALAWLWKNRRRVLAKRREIQRRRRVSDRDLARWFR